MKKLHLFLALIALCTWLGASTKNTNPEDPNTPTAGVKRMLVVDGAKTTVYPQTLGLKLMGAQILKALKDLEAQAERLNTMGESLTDSESRLDAVEGAME
ncbi:MAG: hypothetical protein IKW38_05580 [Kiritimatiellae bacterium]|nr:hypothetical protein [Kiritimatiellia bacterium]